MKFLQKTKINLIHTITIKNDFSGQVIIKSVYVQFIIDGASVESFSKYFLIIYFSNIIIKRKQNLFFYKNFNSIGKLVAI